jgi:hypothetical protein
VIPQRIVRIFRAWIEIQKIIGPIIPDKRERASVGIG